MLSKEQIAFRDRVVALAKEYGPRYGLDWRLMAAAAILESGWGKSRLALHANNLFGIKATASTPEQEVYLLHSSEATRRFRLFFSDEEAFCAYGKLLTQSSHYAQARWMALKVFIANMAPIYCPNDPDYRAKLMQLIGMLDQEKSNARP